MTLLFSQKKNHPKGPDSKVCALAILSALVVFSVLFLNSLFAHSLEASLSFFQLHARADVLLAVQVQKPITSEQGAELIIKEVYQNNTEQKLQVSELLITADRKVFFSEKNYQAQSISFAFLAYEQGEWRTILAPYLSYTSSPESYRQDQKLNFMGQYVSKAMILSALMEQSLFVPQKLLDQLKKTTRDKLAAEKLSPFMIPLGDERCDIYRRWLRSDNPLLAISALVDAYEVANEGFEVLPGMGQRILPEWLLRELSELAVLGLESSHQWLHSAALAIFERTEVPSAARLGLLKLCAYDVDQHFQIVRQEACRALGALPNLQQHDLSILIKALDDDSLRNKEEDYPVEGIKLAAQSAAYADWFFQKSKDLLSSKEWYEREAGLRICMALKQDRSYQVLFQAWQEEAEGEMKELMFVALSNWASIHNISVLMDILKTSAQKKILPLHASKAFSNLVALGKQALQQGNTEVYQQIITFFQELLALRKEMKPQDNSEVLAGLARLGHDDALLQLLELSSEGFHSQVQYFTLLALKEAPDTELFNGTLFDAFSKAIQNSKQASFRQALIDIWCERFYTPEGKVLEPEARDISPPAQATSIEPLALGWLAAKNKQAWEHALVKTLEHEKAQHKDYILILIRRFKLGSALHTLQALSFPQDPLLEYRRIQALEALGEQNIDQLYTSFYSTLSLEQLFQNISNADLILKTPRALPLIGRFIKAITYQGPNQRLYSLRSTLYLSKLTGLYQGFLTAFAFDSKALEQIQKRWEKWHQNVKGHLTWDNTEEHFTFSG